MSIVIKIEMMIKKCSFSVNVEKIRLTKAYKEEAAVVYH